MVRPVDGDKNDRSVMKGDNADELAQQGRIDKEGWTKS